MPDQPADADLLDQGPSFRCGAYSDLEWWASAGHEAACRASAAWANYIAVADAQLGLSFGQVHGLVTDWEIELGVPIRWYEDGYIRDFGTLQQLVRDNWCVVVGIYENDVVDPHSSTPPQRYFHFVAVNHLEEDPAVYGVPAYTVSDPYHLYDGEDGIIAVEDLHKAIRNNWDAVIIGISWRFDAA